MRMQVSAVDSCLACMRSCSRSLSGVRVRVWDDVQGPGQVQVRAKTLQAATVLVLLTHRWWVVTWHSVQRYDGNGRGTPREMWSRFLNCMMWSRFGSGKMSIYRILVSRCDA